MPLRAPSLSLPLAMLLAGCCSVWSSLAASVTLAWDPSPSTNVVSYILYVGSQSRAYTNTLAFGNVTAGTVTGLAPGSLYYFTATARDSAGLESDFSNEIAYRIPDLPVVSVSATDPLAGEPAAGQGGASFTLTRFGSAAAALTVRFTFSGTALAGADFASLGTSVTFAPGISAVTVPVTALDDALAEPDETLVLTLAPESSYAIGAPASAAVTIRDDELPVVTVRATDPASGEPGTGDGTGTLEFFRRGLLASPLTVRFTVIGTAANGLDFTYLGSGVTFPAGSAVAVVTVNVLDDTALEAEESVSLTLLAGTGYAVGSLSSAAVAVRDDEALALAAALDTPGWTWTGGGDAPAWLGQTNLSHDGSDAARSGAIGDSRTNWIETTVAGPGTLTFWWKVSSEANYDFVRFFVNGGLKALRAGEADWTQATYVLGAGPQKLRWDYRKDTYVVAGQDAAWVDQVSFTPSSTLTVASANPAAGVTIAVSPSDFDALGAGPTPFTRTYDSNSVVTLTAPATVGGNPFLKWQENGTNVAATPSLRVTMDRDRNLTAVYQVTPLTLPMALDTAGWAWTTGGPSPWLGQTNVVSDGIDAARSGAMGHLQTNWIQTTVTGPGTLTFYWKVSSEANYDFVRFFVNGVLKARSSGESNWVQEVYNLSAGPQVLRWDYFKDPWVIAGQDCAWVDQVSFTPTPTLTVASANPGSGVAVSVAPNDLLGQGGGSTAFTRTYESNALVTLTAPAAHAGNPFLKWQENGTDVAATPGISVKMDRDRSLTAVYQVTPLTLPMALDTTGWVWTTGGPSPWFGQTNVVSDGVDAARSGAMGHTQTNWIETVVAGPGTLTFWWKVSSEANYDFLRFFVNGVLQAQRSGEADWAAASYTLGTGAQSLRWDYRKDPSVVLGQDAAWVDRVAFVPSSPPQGSMTQAPQRFPELPAAPEPQPAVALSARAVSGGGLRLEWPTLKGWHYVLQSSLDGTAWEPVCQAAGDGAVQVWQGSANRSREFFRLAVTAADASLPPDS